MASLIIKSLFMFGVCNASNDSPCFVLRFGIKSGLYSKNDNITLLFASSIREWILNESGYYWRLYGIDILSEFVSLRQMLNFLPNSFGIKDY